MQKVSHQAGKEEDVEARSKASVENVTFDPSIAKMTYYVKRDHIL